MLVAIEGYRGPALQEQNPRRSLVSRENFFAAGSIRRSGATRSGGKPARLGLTVCFRESWQTTIVEPKQ